MFFEYSIARHIHIISLLDVVKANTTVLESVTLHAQNQAA